MPTPEKDINKIRENLHNAQGQGIAACKRKYLGQSNALGFFEDGEYQKCSSGFFSSFKTKSQIRQCQEDVLKEYEECVRSFKGNKT